MSAEAERINREYAELVARQARGENVGVEIFGITEEAGEKSIVLGEQPQPNVWCSKPNAESPALEGIRIPELSRVALLDDLDLVIASLQDAFTESHASHMAAYRLWVALDGFRR